MAGGKKAYSRYLPITPDVRLWELFVINSGYTRVDPGDSYPPWNERPEKKPLNWNKGRIFEEYEIIYITQGGGTFESKESGKLKVQAGSIILLFPGVWHKYSPDPATGWDEHWVGFKGPYAERLILGCFDPGRPVLPIGFHGPLLHLFVSIEEMMESQPVGYRYIIAAQASEIIARVHALMQSQPGRSKEADDLVQKASCHLIDHAGESVDFHQLARNLGVGYSTFRRIFKEQTGFAPSQYHLHIRLVKAQQLLQTSSLKIGEIADLLGFESLFYFSRIFKKKHGMTPSESRKLAGKNFGTSG